jgi:hypothetical protein
MKPVVSKRAKVRDIRSKLKYHRREAGGFEKELTRLKPGENEMISLLRNAQCAG